MAKSEQTDNGVTFLAPDAELPAANPRGAYTRWPGVRATLEGNPNVWAVVVEAKQGEPGFNSVHGKKTALIRGADNIEAEIRTENGVRRLYARAIA